MITLCDSEVAIFPRRTLGPEVVTSIDVPVITCAAAHLEPASSVRARRAIASSGLAATHEQQSVCMCGNLKASSHEERYPTAYRVATRARPGRGAHWHCLEPSMPLTAAHELSEALYLGHDPAHVGRARRQVRKTLHRWDLHAHADLAELIVSELVTNALRHGAGPIEVHLFYRCDDLRIEVRDAGQGRPVRREVTDDDECGRGLLLLDGLLDIHGGAWGVRDDKDGAGKTVYVEVSLTTGPVGSL
jgi:anti-sigma regulatory factor (Ser/Thr protein kinase)